MYIFKFLDKLSLTLRPYCIFTWHFQTQQINKNERHLKAVSFTHINMLMHIEYIQEHIRCRDYHRFNFTCRFKGCRFVTETDSDTLIHFWSKASQNTYMFNPLLVLKAEQNACDKIQIQSKSGGTTSDPHPARTPTHSNISHNKWFIWLFFSLLQTWWIYRISMRLF